MKIVKFLLLIVTVFFTLIVALLFFCSSYLSYHNPIKSKTLIVDAWISGIELEDIVSIAAKNDLQNVIVVGQYYHQHQQNQPSINDYDSIGLLQWKDRKGFLLLANSSLLVDLAVSDISGVDTIKSIVIKASDTKENNIQAHFNIALNGEKIGDDFVSDDLKKFEYACHEIMDHTTILSVNFDNDCHFSEEQRNLYIKSIYVNDIEISLNKSNSVLTNEFDIITTGFCSMAGQKENYLQALGLDVNSLSVIEFEIGESNQTLRAAQMVNQYILENPLSDLNVSSVGFHGRRTYLSYKESLPGAINIGIINSKQTKIDKNNWFRSWEGIWILIDESISFFVTLIRL